MSAALVPQIGATDVNLSAMVFADSGYLAAFDDTTDYDHDSDEPPAGADFHDSVNEESRLQLAVRPDISTSPYTSSRHSHPALPPLKPPPAV
jgi:hypothetical protein